MLECYCFSHVILNEIFPQDFKKLHDYHFEGDTKNQNSQQKFQFQYYRQFQFCKFTFNRICFIEFENLLNLIHQKKTNIIYEDVEQAIFDELKKISTHYFQVVIFDLKQIWLNIEKKKDLKVIFTQMHPSNKYLQKELNQQENNLKKLIRCQLDFLNNIQNQNLIFKQSSSEAIYQSAIQQLKITNYVQKQLFDEAYEINLQQKDNNLNRTYDQIKSNFEEIQSFFKDYCKELMNRIPYDENNIDILKTWLQKISNNNETSQEFTLKFIQKRELHKSLINKQMLENIKYQTKQALHDLIRVHFFALAQTNKPIKLSYQSNKNLQQKNYHEQIQKSLETLLHQKIIYLEQVEDQQLKELIPKFQQLQQVNSQQSPSLLIFKILQLESREQLLFQQDQSKIVMKVVKKYLRDVIFQFLKKYFIDKSFDLEMLAIVYKLLEMPSSKHPIKLDFTNQFLSIVNLTFQNLKIKVYDKEIIFYNKDYIKQKFQDKLNRKLKQKDHKFKNIDLAEELTQVNHFKEEKALISSLFSFLLQSLRLPLEKSCQLVAKNLQRCIDSQEFHQDNQLLIKQAVHSVTEEVMNSVLSLL